MKCGYVVYRCRMCSQIIKQYESDVLSELSFSIDNPILPDHTYNVPLISYHRCESTPSDLGFSAKLLKNGVVDLIGAVEDENATM